MKLRARLADARELGGDVEPPFGGDLLAPLGHQAAVLGAQLRGDTQHLIGHRELEVHARLQQPPEGAHVAILDVTAVLAQMQRDAVGAGALGGERGVHGVGKAAAPRLAQCRHVIDVDP